MPKAPRNSAQSLELSQGLTTTRQTECATHAKTILIGEHSVVYGYNALALPLKALTLTTTIAPQSRGLSLYTHNYHGLFADAPSEYDGLNFLATSLIAENGLDTSVSLTYKGQIPMERGLGSSAATALGTVRAINQYFDLHFSDSQIIEWANKSEQITHGSASGLDVVTVKSDHLVSFNKERGPREINHSLGAYLVISDTGQLGNTKEAVTQVSEQIKTSSEKKSSMDSLGRLSDDAMMAWNRKDVQQLGTIFNNAQSILHAFSLSTEAIDRINSVALDYGALGSKLSGSGLGGVVISLVRDLKTAIKLKARLCSLASQVWIEAI